MLIQCRECVNDITYWYSYVTLKSAKRLTFAFCHSKTIIMSVLTILIVLIVVGVLLWLVNSYIPMDRKIKNILNAVVVILVVVWLLKVFGLFDSLKSVKV